MERTIYVWETVGECLNDVDEGDIITGTATFCNHNDLLLECKVVEIQRKKEYVDNVTLKVIRSEYDFRPGDILIWDHNDEIQVWSQEKEDTTV